MTLEATITMEEKDTNTYIKKSLRRELLEKAADAVDGDRNVQYGDPNADFLTIAELWNSYLFRLSQKKLDASGRLVLGPEDVAAMMILLKVSRISWSPNKEDHWLDIAGYAACGRDTLGENVF